MPSSLSSSLEHLPPLAGKRILVTGGTTGIGRAIAIRLASAGARIMVFGRGREELDEALALIRVHNPDAVGMTADAANNADIGEVFSMVDREFGGLDILINNASVGAGSLESISDEDREYALRANISGYLSCSREALGRMKPQSHIVMIGSVSADHRNPGGSVYVATKAAIQGFAVSFRQEASKHGIKVSLVEPGRTGADMIDEGPEEQRKAQKALKMLKAEDIASCVAFILSQPPRCNVAEMTVIPLMDDE